MLVVSIEASGKTSGGILIPESAKEKPQKAEVIAVGPGKSNKKGQKLPLDVKVNDIIVHSRYSGTEIKINGVEYMILT